MRAFLAPLVVPLLVAAASFSSPALADDTAAGKSIYERNCLACHGAKGAGDGPAARALRPPPTPFNTADFWSKTTDAKVKAAIKTGRPGTSMMAFGSLTPEQLDSLVAYLRSFAPTP